MKTSPKRMVDKDGIERYTVGKGPTKRRKWHASLDKISEAIKRLSPPTAANAFEGKVSRAVARAKRIVEAEGKPTGPAEERVSQRWYADEILSVYGVIRGTMREATGEDGRLRQGDAWAVLSLAAHLGELVGEAKAAGYFEQTFESTGAESGRKEKMIRHLQDWANIQVRRNPDEKAPFFWESLASEDEGDSDDRFKSVSMIRKGTRLYVTYRDGKTRDITRSSFRRYITRARTSLKR